MPGPGDIVGSAICFLYEWAKPFALYDLNVELKYVPVFLNPVTFVSSSKYHDHYNSQDPANKSTIYQNDSTFLSSNTQNSYSSPKNICPHYVYPPPYCTALVPEAIINKCLHSCLAKAETHPFKFYSIRLVSCIAARPRYRTHHFLIYQIAIRVMSKTKPPPLHHLTLKESRLAVMVRWRHWLLALKSHLVPITEARSSIADRLDLIVIVRSRRNIGVVRKSVGPRKRIQLLEPWGVQRRSVRLKVGCHHQ